VKRFTKVTVMSCLALAACGGSPSAPSDAADAAFDAGVTQPDGLADHGTDTVTGSAKRVFYLPNGTLGQIRDTTNPLTGLEIADADCTQAGASHGGGQWRAWLSSSTMAALDRIADVGPWYRLDQQTLLFENRASIVNGPLVPINAQPNPGNNANLFWSGTLADGTPSSDNCQDWTAYGSSLVATVGRVDTAGAGWVDPTPLECSTYLALLCFEQ
jgi:hypothetical protein